MIMLGEATGAIQATTSAVTSFDQSKYVGLPTKSAKIRAMSSDGMTKSQIAKALDIRYQFVRNVLIVPLKRA
jgi:hypothetical protein